MPEILFILLGIAIFLLGPAGCGFYCFYEFTECQKAGRKFPPAFGWFLGFLSLVPTVIYLLILLSNFKDIFIVS